MAALAVALARLPLGGQSRPDLSTDKSGKMLGSDTSKGGALSKRQIAERLGLSENTVKTHAPAISSKLGRAGG